MCVYVCVGLLAQGHEGQVQGQWGQTEKAQLLTYLANASAIHASPANNTYHCHIVTVSRPSFVHQSAVVFNLVDNYNSYHGNAASAAACSARLVAGGNSFRSIARTEYHRYACTYRDNADDTYDVICPIYDVTVNDDDVTACINITIHVTYVNYGAYRWDGVYINDLLWASPVCSPAKTTTTGTEAPRPVLASLAYTGWYRDRVTDPWRWVRSATDTSRSSFHRLFQLGKKFKELFDDSQVS